MSENIKTKSCGYQGYEFGAGYLDSICVDGVLFDADYCDDDGNLYDREEDVPCPQCRPSDAIKWWTRRMQNTGRTNAEARFRARHLVGDIRKNRGLDPSPGIDPGSEEAALLREKFGINRVELA